MARGRAHGARAPLADALFGEGQTPGHRLEPRRIRDAGIPHVKPTPDAGGPPAGHRGDAGPGPFAPQAAQSLLNFPDLESETALIAAPIEHIDWVISRMLDHGESMRPEPWENMPLARQRASQALMRAQMDGVAEERWQLVAVYVEACNAALEAEKQAAQPQAQPALPAGPDAAAAMPMPGGM